MYTMYIQATINPAINLEDTLVNAYKSNQIKSLAQSQR